MMEPIKFKSRWGETHDITFYKSSYCDNGRLYIGVMCEEGPYCDVTVNLSNIPNEKIPGDNYGFLDANNGDPNLFKLMEENGWIKRTGALASSGYCMYPLVKFTDKFLALLED